MTSRAAGEHLMSTMLDTLYEMHTQAQAHSMQTLTHPDNGGSKRVDGGHGAGVVHSPPLAAACILLGKRCLDNRRRMLLRSALATLEGQRS